MITKETIDQIQITANPRVLQKLFIFVSKLSQALDIEKEDLLSFLGIGKSKYSIGKQQEALEFNQLSEEEKLKDPRYQELQVVIDYIMKFSFLNSPIAFAAKLSEVFIDDLDNLIDNKPTKLLGEFFELLELATKQPKETLLETDYTILTELFIRILIKPMGVWGETFLLKKFLGVLTNKLGW